MQLLSETTISPFEPSQFVTPQFEKMFDLAFVNK